MALPPPAPDPDNEALRKLLENVQESERVVRESQERTVKRKREEAIWSGVIAILGIIGILFSLIQWALSSPARVTASDTRIINLPRFVDQVESNNKRMTALESTVSKLSTIPPEIVTNLELTRLAGKLEETQARQKAIEEALLTTPEKALSVPLLRKEIDQLSAVALAERSALRAEIDRLHSSIGTLMTILGGVFVTVLIGSGATIYRSWKLEPPTSAIGRK